MLTQKTIDNISLINTDALDIQTSADKPFVIMTNILNLAKHANLLCLAWVPVYTKENILWPNVNRVQVCFKTKTNAAELYNLMCSKHIPVFKNWQCGCR